METGMGWDPLLQHVQTDNINPTHQIMEIIDPNDWDSLLQNITFYPNETLPIDQNWGDIPWLDANSTIFLPTHPTWNHLPLPPLVQRNWSDLNQTEKDDYFFRHRYPKRYDKDTALPMTVFYGVLFILGVPGNLLTCFIILLNSYMKAPPNYFLFNLAIVDIITLTMGKVR